MTEQLGTIQELHPDTWQDGMMIANVFSQLSEQLGFDNHALLLGTTYFACVVSYSTRKPEVSFEECQQMMIKAIPELFNFIADADQKHRASMN